MIWLGIWRVYLIIKKRGGDSMKHIKTVNKPTLQSTMEKGGCGECQASCQSACKTSCGIANQQCEKKQDK